MKIIHRVLSTKVLIPLLTFSLGALLTNVFTTFTCPISEHLENHKTAKTESFLLILILSAPDNWDRRNAIRETWLNLRPHHNSTLSQRIYIPTYDTSGWLIQESIEEQANSLEAHKFWLNAKQITATSTSTKVIHKFVIGTMGLTGTRKQRLLSELGSYDDLLLLDSFYDSYKSLTKKLVLSLKHVSQNHSFRYLLKCDDDTYVMLDQMLAHLLDYDDRISSIDFGRDNPTPQLYWGYFNGRANIKTHGQWKETHFNLCSKYLPYALGGGYVISQGLVEYVEKNANVLSLYASEDISVGIWFSGMRNVFRKHDCRFDTAYMARKCKDYYMVLHKRSAEDMREMFKGDVCNDGKNGNDDAKRPVEYFYNWKAAPMQCCDTLVNW